MAATNAGRAGTGGVAAHDREEEQSSQEGGGRLVDRVRARVTGELNAQKNRVTDALDGVADTVRRVGEPLREDPYTPLGHYAENAASRIEEFAADLRDRDVMKLAQDVGEFARRRPAAFVGASLAAGILAARFLKSSAEADEPGADRPTTTRRGARAARPASARGDGL